MRDGQKDAFQRNVIEQLNDMKRAAFKGPIALGLDLATTRATAPQAHTIAKNLLDLLSQRRSSVKGKRSTNLYNDDSQIHALSVSCRHGEKHPAISIDARPFKSMLKDLELTSEVMRALDESDRMYEMDQEYEAIQDYKRLIQREDENRKRLGDHLFEALAKMQRWQAQRSLLRSAALSTQQLSWLYGLPNPTFMAALGNVWEEVVRTTPLRIQIGELPTRSGSSDAFIEHVDEQIKAFKKKWDWLISPLVVPVALEVMVRPAPTTPRGVLHDLDNVVRDYLIPKIVPTFGTVTDHRWTIDFEDLKRRDPGLAARWQANGMAPKATRAGIPRYEAWRLPKADSKSQGFVSVAMVGAEMYFDERFQQMDNDIEKWGDKIEAEAERRRW